MKNLTKKQTKLQALLNRYNTVCDCNIGLLTEEAFEKLEEIEKFGVQVNDENAVSYFESNFITIEELEEQERIIKEDNLE